jgi:hypothetical protein
MECDERTSIHERLAVWLWYRQHVAEYGRARCKHAAGDSKQSIASLEDKTVVREPQILDTDGGVLRIVAGIHP